MTREAYHYVRPEELPAWERRGWVYVNDMGPHLPQGVIVRAESDDAKREAARG